MARLKQKSTSLKKESKSPKKLAIDWIDLLSFMMKFFPYNFLARYLETSLFGILVYKSFYESIAFFFY